MPWIDGDTLNPRPRGVQDAEGQRAEVRDPDGEPTAEWPVAPNLRDRILAHFQGEIIVPRWFLWMLMTTVLAVVFNMYAYFVVQVVR